jgi:plastocyanin domain-containing protein
MRLPTLATALLLLLAGSPARATEASGRTVAITVTDDGWVPDRIEVKKGEPLTLVITRTTEHTCATEIVIKDYRINQKLPLNKAVTVKLTPSKTGEVRYACGMDMISGVLVVR